MLLNPFAKLAYIDYCYCLFSLLFFFTPIGIAEINWLAQDIYICIHTYIYTNTPTPNRPPSHMWSSLTYRAYRLTEKGKFVRSLIKLHVFFTLPKLNASKTLTIVPIGETEISTGGWLLTLSRGATLRIGRLTYQQHYNMTTCLKIRPCPRLLCCGFSTTEIWIFCFSAFLSIL